MIEWFRHDTDARNDIKIRKLLRDYSLDTLGAYWVCIEMIYQSGGYAEEEALREELSFYGSTDHISILLAHGLLEEVGNGIVTSQRALSEIKWQDERRQKKVEAGRKGGLSTQAKASNTKQSQAMLKQCSSNAKAHSSTIQDKTIQDNKYNKPVSNDTVFGEEPSSSPQQKQENTDLFGEKIEMEQENVPYKNIAEYWNKAVKGKVSQIRELTEQRKTLIKERWYEYHNEVYSVIDKVASADFFMQWKACGFDWCFKKQNFVKILEGTYDNNNQNRIPKGNNRSFRPRDITGQYDDIKSEVIEV